MRKRPISSELSDFWNVRQYIRRLSPSKNPCETRGYHKISLEPKEEKDKIICYECCKWFTKEEAFDKSIKYQIDNPFKQ